MLYRLYYDARKLEGKQRGNYKHNSNGKCILYHYRDTFSAYLLIGNGDYDRHTIGEKFCAQLSFFAFAIADIDDISCLLATVVVVNECKQAVFLYFLKRHSVRITVVVYHITLAVAKESIACIVQLYFVYHSCYTAHINIHTYNAYRSFVFVKERNNV